MYNKPFDSGNYRSVCKKKVILVVCCDDCLTADTAFRFDLSLLPAKPAVGGTIHIVRMGDHNDIFRVLLIDRNGGVRYGIVFTGFIQFKVLELRVDLKGCRSEYTDVS